MSQIYKDSAADLAGVLTLTGNSGGAVGPSAGNINVVGTGSVTVTGNPGTNTLTIAVAGEGSMWTVISANQTLAANNGYICGGGGALSLALPATSVVGDTIQVILDGSTSWTITQAAGQQIKIGNTATTAGATGALGSTQQGDAITLVCRTANLTWLVLSSMGNPTVV